MECLGIPVDHRLRSLIREVRPIDSNVLDSDHIRILQEFGTSLKVGEDEDDYLATCDLSFGIEMARPETKGGILVALLQPHSSQDNSDGFLAGKRNCSTINAVSELISVASNARLSFDGISVFDAVPFLNEKVTGKNIIEKAHDVFVEMIKAKQPKVVISCFNKHTTNAIVQNLCHRGIGSNFDFDLQGSRQLAESGLELIRVNAFHPSYAINRFPEFSCFKRLLVLEFVKAFSLWQGRWNDETWMANLRNECHEQAKKLRKAEENQRYWKAHYLTSQWADLLEALRAGFKKCFFCEDGFTCVENRSYRLVESKVTWICCDIASILENEETVVPNMLEQLHSQFKSWCQISWSTTELQRNFNGLNGYYEHSALLLLKSKQQEAYARKLENIFYNFLRDLNLSYEWCQYKTICNRLALGNSFRRFAVAFESILEEAHEKNMSFDPSDTLRSMNLNS